MVLSAEATELVGGLLELTVSILTNIAKLAAQSPRLGHHGHQGGGDRGHRASSGYGAVGAIDGEVRNLTFAPFPQC